MQECRKPGARGLAFFLAILLSLIWRIDRLPKVERLAAQCAFISGLAIALVGFGTWQSQWIATLFCVVLTVMLCRGRHGDATQEPSGLRSG